MAFPSLQNDKALRIAVFFLFVVLFMGSIYYYQERMLFCDAAHIFFEVSNKHALEFSGVSRYGAFITQIFPLLASYAHVPLKEALLLYSMSFNLFYMVIAAILLFKYKNTGLGILFALYLTLFVSETYYWTNNEIHQAIGWLFLLFAIVQDYKQHPKNPFLHFSVVIILAALSLFTHPLMLFIFPFLWLFTLLDKDLNPYNRKQLIALSVAFIAICFIKYSSMNSNGYDGGKVHNITSASFSNILAGFSSFMSKTMMEKLLKDYYFIPILFLLGLGAALLKKKYKQIGIVCLFATTYFLAVCLTYSDFLTFYIESEWMPFSIITSALFVYYFLPAISTKWVTISLMAIFIIRINFIFIAASKFEIRKDWIFSVVKEMKQQHITKGYLENNDTLKKMLLIDWGVPVESMMASALLGEKPNRTFFVDSKDAIKNRMVIRRSIMVGCFADFDSKNLNVQYFWLDTTQDYQPISVLSPNMLLHEN